MKTVAKFWKPVNGKVECFLCPVNCELKDGHVGSCGVRVNHGGKLYTYTYGSLISAAIDPVEKKPLFHFYPGHRTLTIATPGCNLHCKGCQNWEISQVPKGEVFQNSFFADTNVPPELIVEKAIEEGCESISYSYSDPTIFAEYMIDVAKLAKERGLKNIMVTAGYINREPLEEIDRYMDAYSIDLKFFSDESYRKYSKGRLNPVLETIKYVFGRGKWVELTTLLVPRYLDEEQLKGIANWIATELAPWVPWHISRFFPYYKAKDLPPTPVEELEKAYRIGKKAGLEFVFVGNVFGNDHESTLCPGCGKVVIGRKGYILTEVNLREGRCAACGYEIKGRF
ncbi:AmmeMemoRadiSam system radical SAM enzyme [Hydrogenivirga sp.]